MVDECKLIKRGKYKKVKRTCALTKINLELLIMFFFLLKREKTMYESVLSINSYFINGNTKCRNMKHFPYSFLLSREKKERGKVGTYSSILS
jgi:hypothetical protein